MNKIEFGDCRSIMREWAQQGVKAQTCVTSPPYYGLRNYDADGQLGIEETPAEYVSNMVEVFRHVRDVLSDDGTVWLNLGDSYASFRDGKVTQDSARGDNTGTAVPKGMARNRMASTFKGTSIKHKDLIGIPWRVAFALQDDGWYLRQDIIWNKPNPRTESVEDRCTKSHEYIFLLSKKPKYYFDSEAIKEPAQNGLKGKEWEENPMKNKRSVWTVTTRPYKGAHFATYPPDLVKPCILAGSPVGGLVLDPFGGSGTTGFVATQNGRNFTLCELNPEYAKMAENRIANN